MSIWYWIPIITTVWLLLCYIGWHMLRNAPEMDDFGNIIETPSTHKPQIGEWWQRQSDHVGLKVVVERYGGVSGDRYVALESVLVPRKSSQGTSIFWTKDALVPGAYKLVKPNKKVSVTS